MALGTGYSCFITGTTLYPYTGAGINFLLTNNSDPLLYLDTQYNCYHVPTDFEYVGLHKEFGHGFTFDIKPYTYNYDNSEKYSNATTITELPPSLSGNGFTDRTYLGLPIAPCNVAVTKKGVTALPCGVDKYNSYRKYGETSQLSQVSKFGIFRAGMWYEWANTNRHQYPTDPLNNWADQALPNFAEKFVTDSYQPYVEYQWHVTQKPERHSRRQVRLLHHRHPAVRRRRQDHRLPGSGVCDPATNTAINPGHSSPTAAATSPPCLPSASTTASATTGRSYVQAAQGSVVPPSSVFDFKQGTSGNGHSARRAAQAAEEHHLPGRHGPQAEARHLRRRLLSTSTSTTATPACSTPQANRSSSSSPAPSRRA